MPFLIVSAGIGIGLAARRPGSRGERIARALGTPALALVFMLALGEGARRLPASWDLAQGVALVPPTSRQHAAEKLRARLLAEPKDLARARTILALDAVLDRCAPSAADALRLHLADEASRIAVRCGTHAMAARAHYEEGDFERAGMEYRAARKNAPEAPLELTELTVTLVGGHHEEASQLLRNAANHERLFTKAAFVCLANAIDLKTARLGAAIARSPTDDNCNLLAEWFSASRADAPSVADLERTLPRCDGAWGDGQQGSCARGCRPVELAATTPERGTLDPFSTMDDRTENEGWTAPLLQSFGAIPEAHRVRGRWFSLLGLHEEALAEIERGLAALGPRAAEPSLESLGAEVRAHEPESVQRLPNCRTALRVPATSPRAARVRAHAGAASPYFEADVWSDLRTGLILERARALARDFRVADARRALQERPSGRGPDLTTTFLDLRETFAPATARFLSPQDSELAELLATGDGELIATALTKRGRDGVGIVDLVGRALPVRRQALVPFVGVEAKLQCGSCGVYALLRSLGDHDRMAAAVGDTTTVARTTAARDRILRTSRIGLHQDPDWALILHVADRMFAGREWENKP